ncbi:MAG TPA: c-type cytochrome domain-containing protein [Polyangiaceae bacterium]|nr:c-type cytochrome domain-containing protein [Polyangiaceae bacterium]
MLFALGALVVVVVADVVLRHLGGPAADFTLFVGRFHPLAVHLPIGIVLLIGAAEAATLSPRLRPRLDPAIALAWPILVTVTAGAFLLGHLLARSGDFAPRLLAVHRRAELFAAVGICLCPLLWSFQAERGTGRARLAYRGLLALTLTVLSVGAHFGGSLTRGETYLTRYAPGPLRGLLGGEPKPAASAKAAEKTKEPKLFTDVLGPLFNQRCASCHGAEKVKGGLRLDSLAALLKGGEDGTVVTPGVPADSALLNRMLLPDDDDDHMPPEGKPGLTPAQIALVRFWIERGANDNLLVRDLLLPPDARKALDEPAAAQTPTSVAPSASATQSAPSATPAGHNPAPSSPPSPGPTGAGTPPAATPSTPAAAKSATAILSEHCAKCHGPEKQKSKLRVDSLAALLAGGKSGPAVVPGNPSGSALIQALALPLGDDKHMPPAKEPQLDPTEIRTLSSFVEHLPRSSRPDAASAPARPSPPAAASAAASATSAAAAASAGPAPAPSEPSPSPDPPDPSLLASLPREMAVYSAAVGPLLDSHCAQCHSGKNPAGGLTMTPHAALLHGGDTGPAVTPGKPERSVLMTRISLPTDDGDHMPPEGEKPLTADEIALIHAWIERGASADASLVTASLPAAAVRALATRPAAKPEPAASTTERHENPAATAPAAPGRSGGCAACRVAEEGEPPSLARWFGGAVAASAFLRRKTRPS